MDFLCFCFPFFCIHWLMGDNILSANIAWHADHLRPFTMGILPASEMGRCMGKVDDTLSDRSFLWSDAVLCNITIFYN